MVALLGGLVSTGDESEALLKHIVAMPTNGRGQEEGNRKVQAGAEEKRVSPLSRVGESQDGEEHG